MLKKIRVDQVRLGMHLHELCGAWIDHPFWKTRFVLREPTDLNKLRGSAVQECVIDTAKGLDVVAEEEAHGGVHLAPTARRGEGESNARPATPARAAAGLPAAAALPATPARASMREESRRAAALVSQSREAVTSLFNEARMGRALDTSGCIDLVNDVAASVWRNPGAMVSLSRLKTHDDYTYMHSVAVCALMISLARQLGMDEARAREAGMAGLLHDMGKAAMPLEILNKPGKLTDAEFHVMRGHPERGHELLASGAGTPETALDVCLHHHERPDGKGYPHGLAGAQISLYAQMGAVCDVYDAITSNRPYKRGWDPAESIARMASWRKGQFDEAVFQAFVKSLGIYPTGSLVRMDSGRLAVVLEQHESSMVTPKVRVFFSTKLNMPVPLEVLDLSLPTAGDRIVGRESNQDWKFPHLEELWVEPEVMRKMRQGS